jgi:hypothetical protein
VLKVKPPDGLHFQRRVALQDTPGLDALTGDIELVHWLAVRGRVTDKATGKAIAQARVEYLPLGGNPNVTDQAGEPRAGTTTGPDGAYALTVMPGPGVIAVTAPEAEAYMPALVTVKERKAFFKAPIVDDQGEASLTIAAGTNSFSGIFAQHYHALVLLEPGEKEEALVKDVALEPPQERKGRVIGPDGQPLTGVTVLGLIPSGLGWNGPRGPLLSDGETLKGADFTVRGINPRANRPLLFYHKDKNLGFFVKELRGDPSEPLTVKLQPCGSASGRVVDQDGQPVAGLRLSVPGRGVHNNLSDSLDFTVTTDKEGRFRAEGLVPGQEYWVWQPGGKPRVFATVVVEPGKDKDMGDIQMRKRDE